MPQIDLPVVRFAKIGMGLRYGTEPQKERSDGLGESVQKWVLKSRENASYEYLKGVFN